MTLTLDFQGQILKKSYLRNGMADFQGQFFLIAGYRNGLIDIERKGYESIGCYTYYVAFSYDLDLGFSM